MKRIAVFQYGWGVQGYTRDLIDDLARRGYLVTFFVDKASLNSGLIDLNTLSSPNIEVVELLGPIQPPSGLLKRLATRLHREMHRKLGSVHLLIHWWDFAIVLEWARRCRSETVAFIGIEKLGLIFAGAVGQSVDVPYIYYSLELFLGTPDDNWFFRATLRFEAHYHRQARATIIQDNDRADVLLTHNGVARQPLILIPIGLPTQTPRRSSEYWHKKFSLSSDHRVFLYFGLLSLSYRQLDKLVDAWRHCPKQFVLVLHGNGNPANILAYCQSQTLSKVFVSTDLVSEAQIPDLISSCEAGLCVYGGPTINDRLTAFSSQKVALNLREGIPIISSDNQSYQRLFGDFQCGRAMAGYSDLSETAQWVVANREELRREARRAFDSIYANEVSFPKLHRFLDALHSTADSGAENISAA